MNVIYLLGAGASKGAGLPTSFELLQRITQQINKADNPGAVSAFNEIVKVVTSKNKNANFEDVLSATGALAKKAESELWEFCTELREPLGSIEKADPEIFGYLHQGLFEMVWEELNVRDRRELAKPYLRKLVSMVRSSAFPAIFTLNYDLSIEAVLEAESVPYSTGFRKPAGITETYLGAGVQYWPAGYERAETRLSGGDFGWTSDGEEPEVRLIKIHGSVDWFRIASKPIFEGGVKLSPEDRIVMSNSWPSEGGLSMMIAGRNGKERLEVPFSTLLREFYLGLKKAAVLVIIGYSFSDEHINRLILDTQLHERNESFDIVVVNGPSWPESLSQQAERTWSFLVRAGRQSLNREHLTGVTVVPHYAEDAIMSGLLEATLQGVLEQRRQRRD
jgi:hypothetical protein